MITGDISLWSYKILAKYQNIKIITLQLLRHLFIPRFIIAVPMSPSNVHQRGIHNNGYYLQPHPLTRPPYHAQPPPPSNRSPYPPYQSPYLSNQSPHTRPYIQSPTQLIMSPYQSHQSLYQSNRSPKPICPFAEPASSVAKPT